MTPLLAVLLSVALAPPDEGPAGMGSRLELDLATVGAGTFPATLSRAGAFRDLTGLEPALGLVAYEINSPFWSDGAEKRRWIALPRGRDGAVRAIGFSA